MKLRKFILHVTTYEDFQYFFFRFFHKFLLILPTRSGKRCFETIIANPSLSDFRHRRQRHRHHRWTAAATRATPAAAAEAEASSSHSSSSSSNTNATTALPPRQRRCSSSSSNIAICHWRKTCQGRKFDLSDSAIATLLSLLYTTTILQQYVQSAPPDTDK